MRYVFREYRGAWQYLFRASRGAWQYFVREDSGAWQYIFRADKGAWQYFFRAVKGAWRYLFRVDRGVLRTCTNPAVGPGSGGGQVGMGKMCFRTVRSYDFRCLLIGKRRFPDQSESARISQNHK